MHKLQVIIASTRPGRKGESVAQWFDAFARKHGKFEVELVDLAQLDLPLFNEPNHPRMQKYEHEHTRNWSATVARADAYVVVTPEYNFCPPPSLVNAFNYLYSEWNYKPLGFVSYGGGSGGMRSVQVAKQLVTTLKMMPMVEAVAIPSFTDFIQADGSFAAMDVHERSAATLLDELLRWSTALKTMR